MTNVYRKEALFLGIGAFIIAAAFLPVRTNVWAPNPIVDALVRRTHWDIAWMLALGMFLVAYAAGSIISKRGHASGTAERRDANP